jgi:class 3 adenylate cyclase/tetratricopeptide (TPR) repeat protein
MSSQDFESKIKCPKCQRGNPKRARFCIQCGEAMEFRCPKCGAKTPAEARFCMECGQSLGATAALHSDENYRVSQSYTPNFLAKKILSTRSAIEGERKLVTVLFADVGGFTAVSENLDPEEVHEIMDGCFRILMDEIHRYEGTINQFTGDGVMALFGAPVAHEDHAKRACFAALSIQDALRGFSEKLEKKYGFKFKMRIGLNSGLVVVGSIGDDLRMDYTAIGDTVNLASRMETSAKPGTILISGYTYKLARDFFEFEPLGKIQVKGKEEPQEAYRLLGTGDIKTRIEAAAVAGFTKFVGRKGEMETLQEALTKARSGSGQVVGVAGEAGVGKSRLIIEMKKLFPKDEYGYLEGQCLQHGGSMAYLPILDILKSYFEITEGEQESLIKQKMNEKILQLDETLLAVLSPLQELLSLIVEDKVYVEIDPRKKREKIFEAIKDLFIRESQHKPLILVFEDLQWIDRTSEEFIDYLIGWLANSPILLIILYRHEYTHSWRNKSYYSDIRLDQLSMESSAELLQAILQEGEVTPDLRDLILGKAGGNPLFVEELAHALTESGVIQNEDHRYILSTKPADIQIPDTIQGIIAARIDRLDDRLKSVMQLASVVGTEFAFPILQAIAETKEDLQSHLLSLQKYEFICEKRLVPELQYIFKHALIQEVAYNSLLLKRRQAIHEKIGMAIEEIYPSRIEEFYETMAYHYARSEEKEKAYRYLKLSAEKAYSHHANWEALRYYLNAVEICDHMPQTASVRREGIEARFALYRPAMFLGYPDEALTLLREGAQLSVELGESRKASEFESKIAAAYALRGQTQLAVDHGERCFYEAERAADLDLMAETARDLCFVYSLRGDYKRILSLSSKVIPLLEAANRHEVYGRAGSTHSRLCIYAGMALGHLGCFEEGMVSCEKARRAAFRHGHNPIFASAFSDTTKGIILNVKGDGKAAVEHLQRALESYEGLEATSMFVPITCIELGCGHILLGDLESARRHVERALVLKGKTGMSALLSWVYAVLAECNLRSGDQELSLFHAHEALHLARHHGTKMFEGLALMVLGRIRSLLGRSQFRHAESFLQQAIAIFSDDGLVPRCALANFYIGQTYAMHAQPNKARKHLRTADSMFRKMGMNHWVVQSQEALEGL